MRKLASIQKIIDIQPILGADNIEVATVLGWKIVVKLDEFQVGDHVIYCEVDSVLPCKAEFEFLRKGCYRKAEWLPNGEGFRLKTIKLRKQLSQGLILPFSVIKVDYEWLEGDDVSFYLGIVKWDPPIPAHLGGVARGNFPAFIPKTDQERVQNLVKEVFIDGKDHFYEETIKLDGSSMTIYAVEERSGSFRYGVCSRNMDLDLTQAGNTFVDVAMKMNIWSLIHGYALQGELMGPGIQGNRENLHEHEFFVFDVFDTIEQRYLPPMERAHFMESLPQVKHVPIIAVSKASDSLDKMLNYVDNVKSINHTVAEGVVFKRLDGEFSFKCISNKFLLKEE